MEQLSPVQASFLWLEHAAGPMHVTTVGIYDQSAMPGGPLRFKQIIRHVEQRVFTLPRFRCRLQEVFLDLGRPYWIADQRFNLEYHLRHIALPAPGDWRQFCIQVARLHAMPLNLRRPPWEMYVIGGLDRIAGVPPGAFAIVSKLHLSLFESNSRDLVNALHDAGATPFHVSANLEWQGEPVPGPLALLGRTLARNILSPLAQISRFPRNLAAAASMLTPRSGHLIGPGRVAKSAPATLFNDDASDFRVFDSVGFGLDRFNRVKRRLPQVTTNDIVLATCGGALRAYLEDRGGLPSRTLQAGTYFNTRTRRSLTPDGGRLELFQVPLHTDIDDPMERLLAIHKRAAELVAKGSDLELSRRVEDGMALPAPAVALGSHLLTRVLRGGVGVPRRADRRVPVNCLITNVPGPQYPLYLCGARLHQRLIASPIASGLGLVFNVSSYDGRIDISFSSCREMLPDPARLAECIRSSHAALLKSAGRLGSRRASQRGSSRPTSRRTRKAAKRPVKRRRP